ncbi:hypothetical protein ACN077_20625 [Clostridium chromiireducens]|uniref:hypothetical protein n=1 Tax=Clostridium chromiireducens TaxID=225345 RepID=UPI003AF8D953
MPIYKAEHKENFTQILNEVLSNEKLSYGARGLMAYVLTHCDNWVFTGEDYFTTKKDKLSKIKGYLKELILFGYLKRYQEKSMGGVFGKMIYIFFEIPRLDSPLAENQTTVKTSLESGVSPKVKKPTTVKPLTENQITAKNGLESKVSPKTVLPLTDSPLTVSPLAENHILNNTNINNNKKEKGTNLDKLINSFSDNEDLKNTLQDFLKMRKSIKKPMTDRALKIMLNKLSTYGDTTEKQILILENSIENCWQGIFPLKKEDNEASGKLKIEDMY